jgi:ABC-2 type transport system ATP-binding protein
MISVKGVSKHFGPKQAVVDVSFTVERGEILGFLGPNGAGKSTTMRMITGFFPPSSGSISVGGHDIVENPLPAKRMMGYLPESAPAYTDMTVTDFLDFAAAVRGLRGADKARAIERVIEMCFLQSVRHQSVETLSKGYRHRTCFAQSIIHDPDVLIMDEPTDGLDPNQKHEVRSIIKEMGKTKAIIFSTHILEEVDAVCSRAIIIDRGRVVANGTPQELRLKGRTEATLTLRLKKEKATRESVSADLRAVTGIRKQQVVEEGDQLIATIHADKQRTLNGEVNLALFELAKAKDWRLITLRQEEGRLDEVFRAITVGDAATAEKSAPAAATPASAA